MFVAQMERNKLEGFWVRIRKCDRGPGFDNKFAQPPALIVYFTFNGKQ